jgi:purine-binding chemotaxis protein CheW
MVKEIDGAGTNKVGQFLTFRLVDEIFGVPIELVREVLDYVPVARVPGAVSFLKGVINLRGAVVPVADIRVRFGMEARGNTENTCIIVVEVEASGENEAISVGVLADQVLEVAEIAPSDIQMHPNMGTGIPSRYLRGLGKVGEEFFMVLDVGGVIRDEVKGFSHSLVSRENGDGGNKAVAMNN